MAPSAMPVEGFSHVEEEAIGRTAKRIKLKAAPIESDVEEGDAVTIPSHPLGIRPSGNAYTASHDIKTACGPFARIPDELLITLLEGLDAQELVRLGSTCKAFYAFTRLEELWRTLFIESPPDDFVWNGTWRSTYLRLPASYTSLVSCRNLFSDVLYRPFHCTYTPLEPYTTNIPSRNSIPRLSDLSPEEFSDSWTDKPFVLTTPVKQWPIYNHWTPSTLVAKYPDVKIRAEAVDWPLKVYTDYMNNSLDESPLYLFDRAFVEKLSIAVGRDTPDASYWPPTCFGEDLFSVLGDQRPDCRWMIMGPARSGSTFHKDPNATSAWNAVLTGRKYWLMFPSSPTTAPPPGVILSADASEITSPLSIAEYLLSFHALARRTPGCREAICHAGEVLHVPSGWFHLVVNLDESLALTQNFVPRRRLADVLGFLRDTGDQASGFKDEVTDPYGLFVERLGKEAPEVLEEGMRELKKRDGAKIVARSEKWEQLVKKDEEDGGGFSFGFGDDSDEEVP
ncbi:Clavaminate synthase-like protein [Mytilinidion resinicola]|uniref:Clavaminate synthase-like protein n=1 Tax=Mytilinidion resinicola TaxID=574789 RepID=A0A6A6YF88_9PEZI|nr:Clavaminate synthase-like protein [Mytilinidion resinicola]KAF2806725.1 Clavaminate synthase-like protein [Mytilinidion resinicola]